MSNAVSIPNICELSVDEIDEVAGGPAFIPLIIAGTKAALASSTGKAIAAGAFVAAVSVATAVMD